MLITPRPVVLLSGVHHLRFGESWIDFLPYNSKIIFVTDDAPPPEAPYLPRYDSTFGIPFSIKSWARHLNTRSASANQLRQSCSRFEERINVHHPPSNDLEDFGLALVTVSNVVSSKFLGLKWPWRTFMIMRRNQSTWSTSGLVEKRLGVKDINATPTSLLLLKLSVGSTLLKY